MAAYLFSFYILATFWRDHRKLFRHVRRVDPALLRLTLASLGAIALLPFPTALLAEYRTEPLAVALYAGVITCTVGLHLAIAAVVWRHPDVQAGPISDRLGRGVVRGHRPDPAGHARAHAPDLEQPLLLQIRLRHVLRQPAPAVHLLVHRGQVRGGEDRVEAAECRGDLLAAGP
ncbi:Protein of unknown function [Streptomyces indicus]|uniref:Uncharacterized protein n=1 Tax=Streptomyces indicus TaxID=417292 RepID=A0A1G8TRL7_9ACTN|nr:Protein of unknown function [Streptomyces indicus]